MSRSTGSSTYSVTINNSGSYRSNKKRARHYSSAKDKRVDRISELPDSIILHILSFLNTEDAVRSGVLSKRFAYLWTNLGSLEFVNSNLEFINNTLFFHNRSNLQKFSIVFPHDYTDFDFYSDRWVRLLFLSCPVKDLTLKFDTVHYRLPQHVYSNSSIIKLNLLGCEISPEGPIKWESLQSLTMSDTDLPDLRINKILLGCPSLEVLEFSRCIGFTKIFSAHIKRLKKLVIRDYRKAGATLEIFAPHLQSFVFSGKMDCVKCKLYTGNSLINCSLDFCLERDRFSNSKDKAISMLTSLLEDVCHVKDVVTIGEWCLEVLSFIEKDGLPFPMFKSTVKCLKVDTMLTADAMAGIKSLVRGLNCLEKLYIIKSDRIYNMRWFWPEHYSYLEPIDMGTDLDLKLKTVEIRGFRKWDSLRLRAQLPFFGRFLLKNASFLEKMTIKVPDKLKHYESVLVELLSFPRSSPCAVVIVSDKK